MQKKQALLSTQIVIFTRYPEAGTTKTRLIPVLGRDRAARLQKKMTEKVVAAATTVTSASMLPLTIHFSGGNVDRMVAWLGHHRFMAQQGRDIGERMAFAFNRCFDEGAEKVVVVGSDIPAIDSNLLQEATELLTPKKVVLGPCLDGGYYLIGFCKSERNALLPALFNNIQWSSPTVAQTSTARISELGLHLLTLPTLRDVDTADDLDHLQGLVELP